MWWSRAQSEDFKVRKMLSCRLQKDVSGSCFRFRLIAGPKKKAAKRVRSSIVIHILQADKHRSITACYRMGQIGKERRAASSIEVGIPFPFANCFCSWVPNLGSWRVTHFCLTPAFHSAGQVLTEWLLLPATAVTQETLPNWKVGFVARVNELKTSCHRAFPNRSLKTDQINHRHCKLGEKAPSYELGFH